jgi:hypothetical protein
MPGPAVAALVPSPDAVRAQLARILASPSLRANPRAASLLAYVVGKTLDGLSGEIKQTAVALEVFGRPASYDPRRDSVVRSVARALRDKAQ